MSHPRAHFTINPQESRQMPCSPSGSLSTLRQQPVKKIRDADRLGHPLHVVGIERFAVKGNDPGYIVPLPLRRFVTESKPLELGDDRILSGSHGYEQRFLSTKRPGNGPRHRGEIEGAATADENIHLVRLGKRMRLKHDVRSTACRTACRLT